MHVMYVRGFTRPRMRVSEKERLTDWMKKCCEDGWFPPMSSTACLATMMKETEKACAIKMATFELEVEKTNRLSTRGRKVRKDVKKVVEMKARAKLMAVGCALKLSHVTVREESVGLVPPTTKRPSAPPPYSEEKKLAAFYPIDPCMPPPYREIRKVLSEVQASILNVTTGRLEIDVVDQTSLILSQQTTSNINKVAETLAVGGTTAIRELEDKLEKVADLKADPFTQIRLYMTELNRHQEVPQNIKDQLKKIATEHKDRANTEAEEQNLALRIERDAARLKLEQEAALYAAEHETGGLSIEEMENRFHIARLQNHFKKLKCHVQTLSDAHSDPALGRIRGLADPEESSENPSLPHSRPVTRSQDLQAPMLTKVDPSTGNSAMFYKPFSPPDVSVLMQKLPPVPFGGVNWLQTVQRAMKQFFAFTWNSVCYSYNRLPQGFALSPGLFNDCLRQLPSTLVLPPGVLLVQYVDDLLLGAPSES